MRVLNVCHLGPTSYGKGLELQEGLVRARARGETGDWLLYPDHPPVLTVGRSPSEGALLADVETLRRRGIEVVEVSRGGDITWHGPGQLVGYPIMDLEARGRDLHRFLRDLEQVLIWTLAEWGIAADRSAGRTGVWVGDQKIASIGVAVRRWVSYHGFALNVEPDLADFDLIRPCGLSGVRMTSIARLVGKGCADLPAARERATAAVARVFGYDEVRWLPGPNAAEVVRELRGSAA
jgi:lipoate-protein ligase B